jgi:predicted DNA-binding protein
MNKPTPKKPRTSVPMQITMPPDERMRLANFCRDTNSCISWAVREAIRAYLDLAEPMVAEIRRRKEAATFAQISSGQIPIIRTGRPRKGETPILTNAR